MLRFRLVDPIIVHDPFQVLRETGEFCLPFRGFFSSLAMIFQTWCSIFRSSFSSDHFGPRLRSSRERRNLIDSSTCFPSRYSSTGSEPRIREEFKKFLTRIFENRLADLRRASMLAVNRSRSIDLLTGTIPTNHAAIFDQSSGRAIISNSNLKLPSTDSRSTGQISSR